MPLKIRNKLLVAFLGLIIVILAVAGITGYYNQQCSDEATRKVQSISEEVIATANLERALEHAIMPPNDYLITGNRRYVDEFKKVSAEMEEQLSGTKKLLDRLYALKLPKVEDERRWLKEIEVAWLNIKEISLRIFEIPDPIGNRDGANLMEEMDYRWAGDATELIHKWHEVDTEEYGEAVGTAEKVKSLSWSIISASGVLLLALGAWFAVFYSRLFVRPIEAIHNGADAIAAGNFKTRLDIKTGDEIEQLSNSMNEMAEKLDDFYGTLERQVEERTRELRASEDRYRVLGMTAPNAIICLKAPDTITFWNRRAEEIFGYSGEEVAGKHMHDLIVPERYWEKAREGMKRFFETGTGPVVGKKTELSALRKDGTEFPIELSLSAMRIGWEWQATGIVRDITDRKMMEDEIKSQRKRAEMYLDIAGVMFVAINASGEVMLINKRGCEILGYGQGEVIGRNWFDNFLPQAIRGEIRSVSDRILAGDIESFEYYENPVLTRSGEERVIAWHNALIRDEGGNVIGHLSSGEDITDRKKAEEKLKTHMDDLEMFRKITIKRELRMEELQRKVDELEKELKRK